MRRSELRKRKHDRAPAGKLVKGALLGAVIGPAVVMGLIVIEGFFDNVFNPSIWTIDTLWIALSLVFASAAAGAFSGAILPFVPDHPWVLVFVFSLSGGIGGAVFWLVQRPTVNLIFCTVSGTLIVAVLLAGAWLEDRIAKPEKDHPQPTVEYSGPSIECPKCNQETRNPDFCEICGRDIRANPPPLVLPDGNVEGNDDA